MWHRSTFETVPGSFWITKHELTVMMGLPGDGKDSAVPCLVGVGLGL